MPKFSFESDIDLIPMLKHSGINNVFDRKFSHLSDIAHYIDSESNAPLFIDMVKHVARIKTDEEGTMAYAVTGVLAGAMSSDEPPSPNVIPNRPFMYFIRAGQNGLERCFLPDLGEEIKLVASMF